MYFLPNLLSPKEQTDILFLSERKNDDYLDNLFGVTLIPWAWIARPNEH